MEGLSQSSLLRCMKIINSLEIIIRRKLLIRLLELNDVHGPVILFSKSMKTLECVLRL